MSTSSPLTRYSTSSSGRKNDAEWFCETKDGWRDLHIATGAFPVSLDRACERRAYLTNDYFARLRDADVVILTLGLNEVWRDGASGIYLNTPPPMADCARVPGRYTVEITNAAENAAALEETRARLLRLNPRARVIVTVSPVSLEHSFAGEDVVVANSRSKSTMRAAAAEFAADHPDVDYFPSYEMITLAPRAGTIHRDGIHITDAAVGSVIGAFFAAHGMGANPPHPEFNEVSYLQSNPDVDAACRSGEVVSGFHHWQEFGRLEGRRLSKRG